MDTVRSDRFAATDPLDRVGDWVRSGLITESQARRIVAHEHARFELAGLAAPAPVADTPSHAPGRPGTRWPSAIESLGYLGGALVIVGLVMALADFWSGIATAWRIGVAVGVMAGATLAGAVVRPESVPPLARLRWTLWALGTAAGAVAGAVFAIDVAGAEDPRGIILAGAVVVTAHAAATWAGRHRPVQAALTLAGLATLTVTAVDRLVGTAAGGIALWALSVMLIALGWWRVRDQRALVLLFGTVGSIVGAVITTASWTGPGFVFASLTLTAVFAWAVRRGRDEDVDAQLLMGIVGAVAMMNVYPATIGYHAEQAGLATGAVVAAFGAGALVLGLRRLVRVPVVVTAAGAVAMLVGAAVAATTSTAVAVVAGLVVSIGLLVLGAVPDRVVCSFAGAAGLLAFVPWSIGHFFPGEGRVPVLIMVTGTLIVALAIVLVRRHGPVRA